MASGGLSSLEPLTVFGNRAEQGSCDQHRKKLDRGLTFREVLSGAGFVDFVVLLSRTPHLIELKIMREHYEGAAQLGTYMEKESRKEGWLVLFDARTHLNRTSIPLKTQVRGGVINNVVVDINPVSPSRIDP
jgi:hypothetical protein